MSVLCMSRVWAKSRAKANHRLTLLAIADHADDYGIAWPSGELLAAKVGVAKRNVQRLVRELEHSGELYVVDRGNAGRTNLYIVTLDVDAADLRRQLERRTELPGEAIARILDEIRARQARAAMPAGEGDDASVIPPERDGRDDASITPGDDAASSWGDDAAASPEPSGTVTPEPSPGGGCGGELREALRARALDQFLLGMGVHSPKRERIVDRWRGCEAAVEHAFALRTRAREMARTDRRAKKDDGLGLTIFWLLSEAPEPRAIPLDAQAQTVLNMRLSRIDDELVFAGVRPDLVRDWRASQDDFLRAQGHTVSGAEPPAPPRRAARSSSPAAVPAQAAAPPHRAPAAVAPAASAPASTEATQRARWQRLLDAARHACTARESEVLERVRLVSWRKGDDGRTRIDIDVGAATRPADAASLLQRLNGLVSNGVHIALAAPQGGAAAATA